MQTEPRDNLVVQIADQIGAERSFDPAAREKLKLCLVDFLACAIEARDLQPSRIARDLIRESTGKSVVIGDAELASAADAAFANAVAGHGLVREDMHPGSVCHFGVVVLPALLAVSADQPVSGKRFVDAAIIGYEVGGKVGAALIDAAFATTFRPTGFVGPIAAAAAISHLLDLDRQTTASALSFAVNASAGLNQWPHSGSDDMFFHAGAAASAAVRSARLALLGGSGSPDILEGEAGLFAAYGKSRPQSMRLFDGPAEILDVYFKGAPVCNYAQTPFQAALDLRRQGTLALPFIESIEVRVTKAARHYPGCDHPGPYKSVLQAKMSIQFAVARALLLGSGNAAAYGTERSQALLDLAAKVKVFENPDFTSAFPSRQGARLTLQLIDGSRREAMLPDVRPAGPTEVRSRFAETAAHWRGAAFAEAVLSKIDGIDKLDCIAELSDLIPLQGQAR